MATNRNRKTSGYAPTPRVQQRPRVVDPTAMFGDPSSTSSTKDVGDIQLKAQMQDQRRKNASLGTFSPSGTGVQLATGRPRDPMFYWRQNNIPFDFTKPEELRKIREFCRLLYMTHAVVAACVDIYSKLPLQGMEIKCKDDQLVEFYTDLFLDQLNYEDHLVKMGRQYWLSGECFTIGAWNETLGVWEDEQLINPDDVEIETTLFLNKPRYMMRLPESLRTILNERSPVWEYQQLMTEYPELAQYTGEDDLMPVSNFIMYQLKFEADDFSNRGISILMRAFRTIIQEEMLMTALDAIADRLYTPLIIAKLGAKAQDLGTQSAWVPTPDQKADFAMSLDAALAADFRVLITHFAVDVESVFGRENVPDLSNDFDRINERILQAFGLSETMLTGASEGETFAADALNRDVVTQLLTHYQRKLKQFFKARAEIVAEAQEHYDYEVRNGERYLLTEEIFEIDEETGEGRIIEQPKLLIPELTFKILNLTDEQAQQEFIESLAASGVPVPLRYRIQTTGFDFDEMIEITKQEKVMLAISEQEVRKETYKALLAAGLPIAPDLLSDFAPVAMQGPQGGGLNPGQDSHVPMLGDDPQMLPNLAPSEEDLGNDPMAEDEAMQDQPQDPNQDQQGPAQEDLPQAGDSRPAESDSERGRMPKPSKLIDMNNMNRPKKIRTKALKKLGIRDVTAKHYHAPDNSDETNPSHFQPTGKFAMPAHVGMRRYLYIPEDMKYNNQDND